MSQMPPATDAGLNAAIDALRAELEDRRGVPCSDPTVPLLSHLTLGHLRAILAALSAPYVPGMQPTERADFWKATGRSAMVTVWADANDHNGTASFYAEVSR